MMSQSVREEKQQLEATARICRSVVPFEKSLEVKCMECIFDNATLLHAHSATREQFTGIPAVIRRDFLKWLHQWIGCPGARSVSDEEHECIFSLLRLLLNEAITEFDFKVFGPRMDKYDATWQLLAERCPNLKRVQGHRFINAVERNARVSLEYILPRLHNLRNLEHIQFRPQVCPNLLELVEAYPNLRSLSICFDYLHVRTFLGHLSKLQKLEYLWLGPLVTYSNGTLAFTNMGDFQGFRREVIGECLRQLPLLQELHLSEWDREHCALHNESLFVPQQPLALRVLRVKSSLKGWTCEMLPRVTKLHLQGPLADVNEFLDFTDLTVLDLTHISGTDALLILNSCTNTLQELSIHNTSVAIDPCELFCAFPNLKKVDFDGGVHCAEGDRRLHPVTADNFKCLNYVNISHLGGPSSILMEILKAPRLENFTFHKVLLSVVQMEELSVLLQQKQIMQQVTNGFLRLSNTQVGGREHFTKFLQTLVTSAPRLRWFGCHQNDLGENDGFCLLDDLEVPGLTIQVYST